MYDLVHPDDLPKIVEARNVSIAQKTNMFVECRFLLDSGEQKSIQLRSNPRELEDGRISWDGILMDISDRKNAESNILKLNRLYQFKSKINELMLRSTDYHTILSEMCRIAVEYGKVDMAWVGLIAEDKETIKPYVWAGNEDGYLTNIKITARKAAAEGEGPSGRAIRSRSYYYCNDIANDPIMAPWREEALKRNYRSSIASPIIVNNEVVALFTFYMSKEFFFDPTEVELLQNVVDNISFGLDKLRITELQKSAEAELRKSEEVNKAIVSTFPDKVFRVRQDGTVLDLHVQNEKDLYVPREKAKGRKFADYLPHDVAKEMMTALAKTFRTKKLVTIEITLPIHGEARFHEARMIAMTQGEALVIIRDVTEARLSEKALKDSLNEVSNYKYAIDQSSLVDISDKDGKIIYVNDIFCKVSQYTSKELIGNDHRILNSGYHEKAFFTHLWETVLSGKVWQGEVREKAKDGHFFWLNTTIVPFMNINGEPYQYVSIRKDITVRKKAETELLKRNHEIKERMKELTCLYRLSAISNNEKYSIYDVLKECMLIIPDAYQYPEITCVRIRFEGMELQSDNFRESEWAQSASIKTSDKEIGVVEAYYTAEMPQEQEGPFLQEERLLINSFADILGTSADQKKAQEQLQESERKFRALVEQATIGVYILQDGVFKYANMGLEKITGYTQTQLLGRPLTDVIHTDDRERALSTYQKRIAGEIGNEDNFLKIINANGETMHINIMPSSIMYEGRPAIMGSVIDITGRIEEEKRINSAVISAQEKERVEIGMELHDNVKQILAASQMSLYQVRKKMETNMQSALDYIEQTKDLIARAVEELRRLTHQLAPVVEINLPFRDRIEMLIYEMNTDDHLKVTLTVDKIDALINRAAQLNIYRIIQEQFMNIKKHAEASLVSISILHHNHEIHIDIKDNGKGFDAGSKKDGIGLENIRRRTDLLGGQMKLTTAPGNGCELLVSIPVAL